MDLFQIEWRCHLCSIGRMAALVRHTLSGAEGSLGYAGLGRNVRCFPAGRRSRRLDGGGLSALASSSCPAVSHPAASKTVTDMAPSASTSRQEEAQGSASRHAMDAEFMAALRSGQRRSDATVAKGHAGHLASLCVRYFAECAEYKRLDPRTQHVRKMILEGTFGEFIAPGSAKLFRDFPLSRMTVDAVEVLRDRKMALPEGANSRVKAMRQVFKWGLKRSSRQAIRPATLNISNPAQPDSTHGLARRYNNSRGITRSGARRRPSWPSSFSPGNGARISSVSESSTPRAAS